MLSFFCGMITSVFLLPCVRYAADERQRYGVERTCLLAAFNDFVQSIIGTDEAPVLQCAVFQYAYDNLLRTSVHVRFFGINIPQEYGRESFDAVLSVHIAFLFSSAKIQIISYNAMILTHPSCISAFRILSLQVKEESSGMIPIIIADDSTNHPG